MLMLMRVRYEYVLLSEESPGYPDGREPGPGLRHPLPDRAPPLLPERLQAVQDDGPAQGVVRLAARRQQVAGHHGQAGEPAALAHPAQAQPAASAQVVELHRGQGGHGGRRAAGHDDAVAAVHAGLQTRVLKRRRETLKAPFTIHNSD